MAKMRWTLGCLAVAAMAMTACDSAGPASPENGNPAAEGGAQYQTLLAKDMGKSIKVEIRASAEGGLVTVQSAPEDLEEANALQARLDAAPGLSARYALIAGGTADEAPAVLRELDRSIAENRGLGASIGPVVGEEAELALPGEPAFALAKSAAFTPEPEWNWGGDWAWFLSLMPAFGECGSVRRLHAPAQSGTITFQGYELKALGMAASHIYPAVYRSTGNIIYNLPPRTYVFLNYSYPFPKVLSFNVTAPQGESFRGYLYVRSKKWNGSCHLLN